LAPSSTCFLGPTRVHNSNGISIGSAVFAQFTSECRWACRGIPFPSKLPLPIGICAPCNTWFLGSTRLSIQMASRSVQLFLLSSRQKVPILYNGRPFPSKLPFQWGIWSTGPPSNMIHWAHSSPHSKWHLDRFSCFCTDDHSVPILYNGIPFPPQNCPSPWGIWTPSNTWFPGPTQILTPNGISIVSAIFAGLTSVSD